MLRKEAEEMCMIHAIETQVRLNYSLQQYNTSVRKSEN
jgi:hypothetical protein